MAQRGLFAMVWPFLSLASSKATPLLLAALGGLLSELSGVINFALEDMLFAGAFGAVWAISTIQFPWIGILGGIAGEMLIAASQPDRRSISRFLRAPDGDLDGLTDLLQAAANAVWEVYVENSSK